MVTMKEKKVWSPLSDLPFNCKALSLKWVFKTKSDGRKRARLVSKGFLQVEVIDYKLSHSPVLSEVPFRILLLTGLQDKKTIYTIDIKKAFLESNVKEDIYIKPPEGLELIGDV